MKLIPLMLAIAVGAALTFAGSELDAQQMPEPSAVDELQVPVLNSLHERHVIGPKTRLVPGAYETALELVTADI